MIIIIFVLLIQTDKFAVERLHDTVVTQMITSLTRVEFNYMTAYKMPICPDAHFTVVGLPYGVEVNKPYGLAGIELASF